MRALDDADVEVAVAAIAVLRGWLERDTGVRVLDALASVALDRARGAALRLAALDALSDLPRDLVQPVMERGAVDQRELALIPDDPAAVRDWIAGHEPDASLSQLHDVVVRAREREATEPHGRGRQEWLTTRGAAHAALARRGSRVALYDLREAFDAAASPLTLDFLTAVTAIGDASCLEPMARAWAVSAQETWWRERLEAAAEAIIHRTRLSGRSAVVKRIRARWPGFV